MTAFVRAGIQDGSVAEVDAAVSLGAEIRGPFPGRAEDTLALALGYARLSNDCRDSLGSQPTDPEEMLEIYYTFHLNDHVRISPDLQVIRNPAGLDDADTVTILGMRAQVLF